MSSSHRPTTGAERDAACAAVDPLLGGAVVDLVLASVLSGAYQPARDAYLAARSAHAVASAEVAAAAAVAATADEVFDAAFRRATGAIRDHAGRTQPRELAEMLGVLPGRLVRLPYRDEIARTRRFLGGLASRTDLVVDAALRDALVAAADALEPAVTAQEAKLRTRVAARAALDRAESEFDRAWGLVVRSWFHADPAAAAAALPVFYRASEPASDEAPEALPSERPPIVTEPPPIR